MTDPLHPTYLPFTADQLRQHFAPVGSADTADRHLRYYQRSLERAQRHADKSAGGRTPTRTEQRWGRQIEKDERFWIAAALMSLFHAEPAVGRAARFATLMQRAGLQALAEFPSWEQALSGPLRLYFEVSLPSPPSYRRWLRPHLDERAPIPYVREAAGQRLEGRTKADAMLLAPDTGVAVIFEAKVLADVSTDVTFDMARNQLARTIDVMLDENPKLAPPLNLRQPDRTCLVLLTPELMRPGVEQNALAKSRLYGWLLPAYRDPNNSLLAGHLPHRSAAELQGLPERLGWATWEDCNAVLPGACQWLTVSEDLTPIGTSSTERGSRW